MRDMREVEGVGNDLLQVLVGVSKPQNVGGQTDAVSADRRGIIAPIVRCYLAPHEVIIEDITRTNVCWHVIGQ